jgi:hypothetical protein
MNITVFIVSGFCLGFPSAGSPGKDTEPAPIVWKFDSQLNAGEITPKVIRNAPQVKIPSCENNGKSEDGAKNAPALVFDGKSQGLLMPVFPVAGCKAFTIEVDIFPEAGGEFEQRFFHAGAVDGARALLELRSNPDGSWYLDTYLRDAKGTGLALVDAKKTHPSGRWHTVALMYDGDAETMSHYVDGVKEKEDKLTIAPMPDGCVSLGVRQNKVCWFKGMIREVRFWIGRKY